MKMHTMIILFFVITTSCLLFDNTVTLDGSDAIPDLFNYTSIEGGEGNYLWETILNPINLTRTNSLMYWVITILLVAVIAAGINFGIAGTYKGQTSDASSFGIFIPILMGFAGFPITLLFTVINREVGAFACGAGEYCTIAILLGGAIAGLLLIQWMIVCIHWWRTGQTAGG